MYLFTSLKDLDVPDVYAILCISKNACKYNWKEPTSLASVCLLFSLPSKLSHMTVCCQSQKALRGFQRSFVPSSLAGLHEPLHTIDTLTLWLLSTDLSFQTDRLLSSFLVVCMCMFLFVCVHVDANICSCIQKSTVATIPQELLILLFLQQGISLARGSWIIQAEWSVSLRGLPISASPTMIRGLFI